MDPSQDVFTPRFISAIRDSNVRTTHTCTHCPHAQVGVMLVLVVLLVNFVKANNIYTTDIGCLSLAL